MVLGNNELLRGLAPEELARLQAGACERVFAAGSELFRQGDPGDGLFVIQDGSVELSVRLEDQRRQLLSTVGPGEILGEMGVVENQPRSATATARTATTAWFIPRAEMLAAVERSPALALALLREISGRLRDFNSQYVREVLQAERLSLIGRLARSIIHDLKNPLNIIGLTAELTGMEGATPETRAQAVTSIRYQVDRINDMVREILEFTQGPHPDLVLTPMDYATFVQSVCAEFRAEAALRSVSLDLEGEPPRTKVLMNPKRLRRLFQNLVYNACEAMPEGGRISIRATADGQAVVTEVEDSGPGLPPEMTSRLFEPFATHGKPHGTGLGLSISKRIVEDHGGWIRARNEPGRGAVFSFSLPLPKG